MHCTAPEQDASPAHISDWMSHKKNKNKNNDGLDDRGPRVRFPAGAGNFSLHHRVENGSGAHPASYPVYWVASFLTALVLLFPYFGLLFLFLSV
jgi:hypothetical protein